MLGNVGSYRARLRRMYVNRRSRIVRHSLYSVDQTGGWGRVGGCLVRSDQKE